RNHRRSGCDPGTWRAPGRQRWQRPVAAGSDLVRAWRQRQLGRRGQTHPPGIRYAGSGMKAPTPQFEVAGIDSLILRLFEQIDEDNMPWMLAASLRLQEVFGAALIDLVPSYTTL